MRYTFKVYERLKREQHIETLFRTGKAFSAFPLKCIWLPTARNEDFAPVRMGVSVPKKKIRLSVNRQRVKRLVREAWRQHKHVLYKSLPEDIQLHLFFVYTTTSIPDYKTIEESVIKLISILADKHQNNNA